MAKFPFVVRIVSGQLLSGALSTHDFWSRYGQLVMVIKLNEGSVLGHQSKYENGTLIHAQRELSTQNLQNSGDGCINEALIIFKEYVWKP